VAQLGERQNTKYLMDIFSRNTPCGRYVCHITGCRRSYLLGCEGSRTLSLGYLHNCKFYICDEVPTDGFKEVVGGGWIIQWPGLSLDEFAFMQLRLQILKNVGIDTIAGRN